MHKREFCRLCYRGRMIGGNRGQVHSLILETRDKVSARKPRPEAIANSVRGVAKCLTESAKAPKTVDTVGRAKGYGCEDEVEKSMRRSKGEEVPECDW